MASLRTSPTLRGFCSLLPSSTHWYTSGIVMFLFFCDSIASFVNSHTCTRRSLSDAGIVAYIGVATIAVVNVTIIARAIYDETGGKSEPTNDTPTSLQDFVNGLTVLTFAYGGHVLMVDIQAVMEKPQDWPKAVWGSQLFMFANYAIVG